MYILIKGQQNEFSNTLKKFDKSEIVAFATSDDMSKFACLIWADKDPTIEEPEPEPEPKKVVKAKPKKTATEIKREELEAEIERLKAEKASMVEEKATEDE